MKKTIAISIVTSAMLFGANVDNLTTDQVNKTLNSTVNSATVTQGQTSITGSADVDGLAITQKGEDGETGNLIDGVTINGTGIEATHIHQGSTKVVDGTVNNVTIDSDSTINNGASISGAGRVSQGETSVLGNSTLKDVSIESTNTISGGTISGGEGEGHFAVTQGTLIVTDANASDATADDVDIKSTNAINGIDIDTSTVRQSYTKIASGADVTGLALNQTNTIDGGGSISNNSAVGQGIVMVDEGSTGTITTTSTNNLNGVNVDSSTVVQDYINVHGGSTATINSTTNGDHHNTVSNAKITSGSTVSQNTLNIDNHSTVSTTSQHENYISDMDIDNSKVVQDAVDINGSTVTNLIVNSHNELTGVDTSGSDVNSSKVEQSVLVINGNSNIDGLSITTNNEIRETDLTAGSSISQSYTTLSGVTATTNAPVLNNSNSVTGTTLSNGASLTQAKLSASGVTLDTLTQDTTNTVDGATIDSSTVEQATIALAGGSVTSLDIDANNNIATGTDIDNSMVSQNHTNIKNSDVSNLTIKQNNDISGGTSINSSTVTQGCVKIGSDSCFSNAEEDGVYSIKTDWANYEGTDD